MPASDMKDIKKACKVIGQLGGGVPAEGDPEHPRTPGDFSQCHPSLGYDEETGVIKKNEGEEQMWSTALSSTVMQPDTGKYVMKCVVDPPDGESAPNNEIMLGVADEDYDVEGGDPDSQGDENATLGAAFTAKGWGWYVFNGAACKCSRSLCVFFRRSSKQRLHRPPRGGRRGRQEQGRRQQEVGPHQEPGSRRAARAHDLRL